MSSNLRNKSYVFRNQQLTRQKYLEKIKELELSSFESREKLNKEFQELREKQSIHRYVVSERNVNSVGSLIFDSKNTHQAFDVNNIENGKYLFSVMETKDSMDLYHVGVHTTELCYELQGCTRVSNCQFCHLCYDDMNVMYSDTCQNSQNLFVFLSFKKKH